MISENMAPHRETLKATNQDTQQTEQTEDTFETICLKSPSKDTSIEEEASVHAEIRKASMFCGCLSILDWQ